VAAHAHSRRESRLTRPQRAAVAGVLATQVWMLAVVAGVSGPDGAVLALFLLVAAAAHLGLGAVFGRVGVALPVAGLVWGIALAAAGAGSDVSPLTVGCVYAVIGGGLAWAGGRLRRTPSP
jgi:hypothetical protein